MSNWPREIRHALRADPILSAVVGTDDDNEVKIYNVKGKENIAAPFITLQILVLQDPLRVYGDDETVQSFRVAVGSWGRDSIEAWQVADVADDAIKQADYSFEPYTLMQVLRIQMPVELQDRDTGEYYLTTQYQFNLGR